MTHPIEIDTANAEFQNALKLIQYTRQSVFLTGKAGTGKSTFLKYYGHRRHQCRRQHPAQFLQAAFPSVVAR